MQQPAQPTWRLIDWIIVPIYRPEYRRLVLWSLTLSVRLRLLSLLVSIVSPIATPGLLLLLRRWFDGLRAEAAEFRRAAYAPKSRLVLQRAAHRSCPGSGGPERGAVAAYENPWV